MSDNAAYYVTLGGDCFEVSPQGKVDPVTRDGLLYKFHVTDLKKNRRMRLVSVFAAGSLQITVSDYEQRIEVACINAIRRAFDNETVSFDQPSDERYYKEIQLSVSDFENQVTRTDAEIRQYIVHKAYWLAYRFPMQPQPDSIIYPIPFDEPADLDYLGATSAEVRRNIQRMANQGLVEKVLEGHARPTERLLSTYESAERSSPRELTRTESAASATSGESDDRRFARLAIEEARKSVPEDDRVHPKVGVVVVKDGRVLATAHRGEVPQCHGEYIALEKKLADVSLAGSTVYTTLEPCTSRNHPKVPCATRLTERKVARVVIGMLDPDDRISGRGQRALRKAGIATELFAHDLMAEIEDLNRDFIREKETNADQTKPALTQADRNAAKLRKYIGARAQVSENGNNWGAMGAEIVEVNDDNVVTLFVASSMQSTTAFAVYVHCDDLQIVEVPMGSCPVRIKVLRRYGETVQLGEIKRWEDRKNPTAAQSAVEKGLIAYHATYAKVGTSETRELRVYAAKDGSNYFVLESKPDGTFYGNNADISKRFMALQVEYEALGFTRQQSRTGATKHRLFIK